MNIVSGRGDMLVKTDRSGKFCILKRNPAIAQKRKLTKDLSHELFLYKGNRDVGDQFLVVTCCVVLYAWLRVQANLFHSH